MSLLVHIRNQIVHNPRKISYSQLKSQNPIIYLKNINDNNNQRLIDCVADYYKLCYTGKKKPGTIIEIHDVRTPFQGFCYKFSLNKISNMDRDSCKVSFRSDILYVSKKISGTLFTTANHILAEMLK